jgi:hypothetical protein
MPQVTNVYALAAAGGAPVVIRCTRVTSRMEIRESVGTNAAEQGLVAQQLTPVQFGNFTIGGAYDVPPNQEPLLFAGYPGDHPPNTVPIGNGGSGSQPVAPGGPQTLGTPIVQLTSLTATPTSVSVTEFF